jgi:hypothetical protein
MGYVADFNDLMATLQSVDKRIVAQGKELRSELKTLDPFEDPNVKYTNMMAELGAQRNAMRIEAEALYNLMSYAEKKQVMVPHWLHA